jgi:hypothetical protein
MSGLRLAHDVLDAQLLDRQKRKIGRVDALMLDVEEGAPPRVATILVGGPVRAERIGRWMIWLARALRALGRVRREGVSRIPFGAVRRIADTIDVDVDGDSLDAGHVEAWLADHVVCRLPGARATTREEKK